MNISDKAKSFKDRWQLSTFKQLYGLFSYDQNMMMKEQGIDFDKFYPYRYFRKIHSLIPYYELNGHELIRVGRTADGSYIMADDYSDTKVAYSLGIGANVSWDKTLAEKGYQVYQYDHTIKKLPEEHPNFHWRSIGIAGRDSERFRCLDTLIKENGHAGINGMILKMDIEGCEWDVLDSVSDEVLQKFDQVLVELHGITALKNAQKICKGLSRLDKFFGAVHIHGNNAWLVNYCGDLVTPDLLEITYVSKKKYKLGELSDKLLPNELDLPNVGNVPTPDIYIGKWNV